jgi:hypothetical protein
MEVAVVLVAIHPEDRCFCLGMQLQGGVWTLRELTLSTNERICTVRSTDPEDILPMIDQVLDATSISDDELQRDGDADTPFLDENAKHRNGLFLQFRLRSVFRSVATLRVIAESGLDSFAIPLGTLSNLWSESSLKVKSVVEQLIHSSSFPTIQKIPPASEFRDDLVQEFTPAKTNVIAAFIIMCTCCALAVAGLTGIVRMLIEGSDINKLVVLLVLAVIASLCAWFFYRFWQRLRVQVIRIHTFGIYMRTRKERFWRWDEVLYVIETYQKEESLVPLVAKKVCEITIVPTGNEENEEISVNDVGSIEEFRKALQLGAQVGCIPWLEA